MISIIKTAIITIIISFISGLLLDYYKNLAPKILCSIGNGIHLELNKKKICAYILTVRNISNKTIHELTLNIQGAENNLKLADAKITKGLKFESSIKDNFVDVYIPFLSKEDEFSVTLYVENQDETYNKPVATIRSPENFKEVGSVGENGIISSLINMPKNINRAVSRRMKKEKGIASYKKSNLTTAMNKTPVSKKTIDKEKREKLYKNRKTSINKKEMAAIISIILVISIGVFGSFYLQEMSANSQAPDTKTNVQKQSTDTAEPLNGITPNTGGKASTSKNTNEKASAGGTSKNTNTKASTAGTTKNTDSKAQTDVVTKSADTKESTSVTNGETDIKASPSGGSENTDKKTSTAVSTENAKTSADETTENADTKALTSGTTKNTDVKASVEGAGGNIDAKNLTDGAAKNTDTKKPSTGANENIGN